MDKKEIETVEEVKPSSKKKLIVISIIIILIIALGVGVFLFMKNKKTSDFQDDETEETEENVVHNKDKKQEKESIKLSYEKIDRFITNLNEKKDNGALESNRFLSLEIYFAIKDDEEKAEKLKLMKDLNPKIRNSILFTINDFSDKELLSKEGKEKLSKDLTDNLNGFLLKDKKIFKLKFKSKQVIEEVLITEILIQ